MNLKDYLEQEAMKGSQTFYLENFDAWATFFPVFDKAYIEMPDDKTFWVSAYDKYDVKTQLEMRLFWTEYEIDQAEGE